jgi:hypothetical protein
MPSKTKDPETWTPDDVMAFLKARVEELPANDVSFAYSLIGAGVARGLSEKQLKWARKLSARIINPKAAVQAVDLGDVSGLVELFDKAAAAGIKWPKLRALTPSGETLRIHRAGEKSKHLGQIMVTTKRHDENVYYGRVDLEGRFHPSQQVSPEMIEDAKPALIAMATDPATAGKAYGKATGSCAFCALPLDDGRSVSVGYGPVCAENFGLPWGQAKRRKAKNRK